jgi:hypothetical protein
MFKAKRHSTPIDMKPFKINNKKIIIKKDIDSSLLYNVGNNIPSIHDRIRNKRASPAPKLVVKVIIFKL